MLYFRHGDFSKIFRRHELPYAVIADAPSYAMLSRLITPFSPPLLIIITDAAGFRRRRRHA